MTVAIIVIGILIFLVGIILLGSSPKPAYRKCKKKPELDCPYRVDVTVNGSFVASGHEKCCESVDIRKQLNERLCKMEPGKDYNGMSITEGCKRQALENKKYWDKINTDGPLK